MNNKRLDSGQRSLTILFMILLMTGMTVSVQAEDFMNLRPKIVNEKKAAGVELFKEGDPIKILLTAHETGGLYTAFTAEYTDSSVPLHQHAWHDESFYILKGSFEVVNGDAENKQIVDADTMMFVPRGTTHGFTSLEPDSKFLVIYTPGGWEYFMDALNALTPEQRDDEEFMDKFYLGYDELMQ